MGDPIVGDVGMTLQPAKAAAQQLPKPPPKKVDTARNGPQTLDNPLINPRTIRSVYGYIYFVRQLEAKYPRAYGFDINRAIRQYFYSDSGTRNTMGVFDKWLGTTGGKNSPALKGIENDLQGMPAVILDPDGDPVNLSHMVVGIDAYYNRRMGISGVKSIPLDAAKGFMLTHGGDFGQVFAGVLLAAGKKVGINDDGPDSFGEAFNFASADQLRGNENGIEIGMDMERADKYSTALYRFYVEDW